MFCQKCGNQVPQNAAMCPICGAYINGASVNMGHQYNPAPPASETQKPKGSKGMKAAIIILSVILVALVAVIILFATGVFGDVGKDSSASDVQSTQEETKPLSERETIELTVNEFIQAISDRDIKLFQKHLSDYTEVQMIGEFASDEECLEEFRNVFADDHDAEIIELSFVEIGIEEFTEEQFQEMKGEFEEIVYELGVDFDYPVINKICGCLAHYKVTDSNGNTYEEEMGFGLYKEGGQWKVYWM